MSTAREDVGRWRRRLTGALAARAALVAFGAGTAAAGLVRLVSGSGPLLWIVGAAVAVVAAIVWWRATAPHAVTPVRTALWLEEHTPGLRYALVSAAESATPNAALERVVRNTPWEESARSALLRSFVIPLVVAAAGAAVWYTLPVGARAGAGSAGNVRGRGAGTGGDLATLGALHLTVRAPAYAGGAITRHDDPALVHALPGSTVELSGSGDPGTDSLAVRVLLGERALALRGTNGGWQTSFTSGVERTLLHTTRGAETRLIALEPVVDSAPVVVLRTPARDSVLRAPQGVLPLEADVHDDLGLQSATFEYIVSSGEGERFTFRSGVVGGVEPRGARSAALRATLSLDALALAPGDVVHLRAVARDRNAVTGPGVGTSESRAIRIARAGEYDSVAVDQAPPAEADKSLISQRMLINLTEALVRRSATLARSAVVGESQRIGRDQARLRKQVSDIIFARFGDEGGSGEHFHGDGHNHDENDVTAKGPLTPEQLLAAAERASRISEGVGEEAHEEAPIVAINRPLLEAYNAMWDAGRELESGAPRQALPAMYRALAAIQKARSAERIYLRGAPPRVVLDLAKVRLQGKDRGAPVARAPRAPLDAERAQHHARFAAAITLLTSDSRAGLDSLLVLRLAVAERAPEAARALEAAIDAIRAGRDVTPALIRARRALDDAIVAADSLPVWGGPR